MLAATSCENLLSQLWCFGDSSKGSLGYSPYDWRLFGENLGDQPGEIAAAGPVLSFPVQAVTTGVRTTCVSTGESV